MEAREIIALIRQADLDNSLIDKAREAALEYAGDQEAETRLTTFGPMLNGYVTVKGEEYRLGFFMDKEMAELYAKVFTRYMVLANQGKEKCSPFWFKEAKSYPLIQDKMKGWTF